MPKYPNSFDQFEKFKRKKNAKTAAGLLAGFALFVAGTYYIFTASTTLPAKPDAEQSVVIPVPDPITQPAAVTQASTPAPEPNPVVTLKKHKRKVALHSKSKVKGKKVAKKKQKSDELVCIPPSKLKALEKQAANSSHR